jgi:hypothetical protein
MRKYRIVNVSMKIPIYNKLRRLQAKKIKKTKQACSLSKLITLVLENGLKKKRVVTLKK